MDYIKEKIANYREILRGLILFLLADISGTVGIVFYLLKNKKFQIEIFVFSFIGLLFIFFLLWLISLVWQKIEIETVKLKGN